MPTQLTKFRRLILIAVLLIFLLTGCDILLEVPETALTPDPVMAPASLPEAPAETGGEIPMDVGYGYGGSFYELYFTDPLNPAAKMEENGPDTPLVAAIEQARLSVDVAVYNMSLYSIRSALMDAHDRGVVVRIVMESDNMDGSVPRALEAAGIPIVGDRHEGLMHNKFVIIDRSEVWMGSMNFTTSGTYDDNNNLVRIRSTKVAEDYMTEFDEMFERDLFGADTVARTPNPTLTIDGVPVEVYFSPDDGVAKRIAQLLRGAQSSIYFMAYSFTSDDFGEILRDKVLDDVTVAGVMDESQIASNQGTEYDLFHDAGMDVFPDGIVGLMHHKVFIIDESIVITGSYNFTASAEKRNDENVVIFFDPEIAAQYMAEFQRVYAEAKR